MSQDAVQPALSDAGRLRLVKRAAWVATLGNLALAVVKISAGLFAGSLAVFSDGIDTAVDVGMGILLLCAAPIAARPPDERYPYGRLRAEAVASKFLAFLILVIGGQLAWNAVGRVLSGGGESLPSMLALWVTIFSIVAKSILAWNQYRLGRKADSSMVLANAVNMRNDILTSFGVLIGLSLTYIFELPILDPLVALLVALWIMKSGIEIYRSAAYELMDGIDDPEIYQEIADAVLAVPEAGNPHRLRVRRLGHRLAIDLDIEVDGQMTIHQGHAISHRVEVSIRERLPQISDVVVHIEPQGKGHSEEESFGIHPMQTEGAPTPPNTDKEPSPSAPTRDEQDE